MTYADPAGTLLAGDPTVREALRALLGYRLVFFAGMPATGKSLLTHQLAHLAHAAGRRVHLLQWDVARRGFEESEVGGAFPIVNGITHPRVRRATGLWARGRVAAWAGEHAGDPDLLLGEVPLIGGRLIEIVQRWSPADAAETVLTGSDCRFVLVVPSDAVRQHIEAERRRRFTVPLHEKELDDAPSHLLDDMWRELLDAGERLGALDRTLARPQRYESAAYRRIYEALLRYRNPRVIPLDTVLPTGNMSVYDFGFAPVPLVPTAAEVERFFALAADEASRGGRGQGEWWQLDA